MKSHQRLIAAVAISVALLPPLGVSARVEGDYPASEVKFGARPRSDSFGADAFVEQTPAGTAAVAATDEQYPRKGRRLMWWTTLLAHGKSLL